MHRPPTATTGTTRTFAACRRHPGRVNTAMCDGSVRFVANAVDPAVWADLASATGGEVPDTF